MKFKNLKYNKMYHLRTAETSREPSDDEWIAKVISVNKDYIAFDDVWIIKGVPADYDYRFGEKNFNREVEIIKEITKETHPEYFL